MYEDEPQDEPQETTPLTIDLQVPVVTPEMVADRIADRLLAGSGRGSLRSGVQEIIDARAKAVLDDLLSAKLEGILMNALETSLRATNGWGEPKGEPITLRAYIEQRAQALMAETVNPRGEKHDGYGAGKKRSQFFVDKYLLEAINVAVKRELEELRAGAMKQVAAALTAAIANVKA